jgi:transaldolase
MPTLRAELERMSIVVVDTGDYRSVEKFKPRDVTISASFVSAALQLPEYAAAVDEGLKWAQLAAGTTTRRDPIVRLAVDWMTVQLGLRVLNMIPGRIGIDIDARLAENVGAMVDRARWMYSHFDTAGAPRSRLLARVPATWEGIRAAEILEKEGIHCCLTLVFGMHQAAPAADARVTMIAPLVGRIVDWHRKQSGMENYAPAEDPGVLFVKRVYNYYKLHGYATEIMAGSFRNVEEVTELAGCDRLLVAPNFLAGLALADGTLARRLDPNAARVSAVPRLSVLDGAAFRAAHAADKMATEKLAEGLYGFGRSALALEKQIGERLDMLTDGRRRNLVRDLFEIFDLDGDGIITREEWPGSTEVFDALDANGDGTITPDEVAAGLGAAFRLSDRIIVPR